MINHDVTNLLEALRRGGRVDARERLYERVYAELHAMAAVKVRHERPERDVGATGLVNEVYLKLAGHEASFENRRHFFGAAARAMHQVLIDRARAAKADRRGGGLRVVDLNEAIDAATTPSGAGSGDGIDADDRDWESLRTALDQLEALDSREAEVVRLRFFGNVPAAEVAAMLGVTERTVERDWAHARAWLSTRLKVVDDASA